MAQNGKGSKPRPFLVDRDVFRDNWDRTFGKKRKRKDNEEHQGTENSSKEDPHTQEGQG